MRKKKKVLTTRQFKCSESSMVQQLVLSWQWCLKLFDWRPSECRKDERRHVNLLLVNMPRVVWFWTLFVPINISFLHILSLYIYHMFCWMHLVWHIVNIFSRILTWHWSSLENKCVCVSYVYNKYVLLT